jgi:hypothetical protein
MKPLKVCAALALASLGLITSASASTRPVPYVTCGGGTGCDGGGGYVDTIDFSRTSSAKDAGPSLIHCWISTDYPHPSHHADGMVNVESTVQCSVSIPTIKLTVQLWRIYCCSVAKVAEETMPAPPGWTIFTWHAAATCYNGARYQGDGQAYLVPPYGYVPTSGTIAKWGAAQTIPDCSA